MAYVGREREISGRKKLLIFFVHVHKIVRNSSQSRNKIETGI